MKKVGRPLGKNKNSRLDIMISEEMKNEFKKITKKNGTNVSVKVCELIAKYIKENKENE